MIVRSGLLSGAGFSHGFSTREGGVSEGAFASLNLARTVGDDPARVAENARRFVRALEPADVDEAPAFEVFEVSQVHGADVVRVEAGDAVLDVRGREADALVAAVAGPAVAVRTADCVPVLLAHPRTGAVCAAHAGWRGVVARVLEAGVRELGAPPGELLAAIGPHIRHFEVSDEVAAAIDGAAHGASVIRRASPRPFVSLAAAARAQLEHLGLRPDGIEDVGGCTLEEADRFFSHRRDAGVTGRHLSAIRARSPR